MKILFLPFVIFFPCVVAGQSTSSSDSVLLNAVSEKIKRNQNIDFSEFNKISIAGKRYTTDSLRNKITFINFWFEACAPCIAEFAALNEMYNKFKEDIDFQFLSFTFEEKETAQRVADKYHIQYPIICVKKEDIFTLNLSEGFPTNIITDKEGKVIFLNSGGFTDIQDAKKVVDSLYCKEIEQHLSN